MIDFGGWEMPVQYPAGTIEEHLAVRRGVGIFDVSHMGELEVRGPQALDLVARARRLFPCIGDVKPEAVRLGIRPIPGDGLTAAGPVPRVRNYYIAVTHSGVTMSPFLGVCVADEVVNGKVRPELADFRPARFFN